jgi:hypothetical protein
MIGLRRSTAKRARGQLRIPGVFHSSFALPTRYSLVNGKWLGREPSEVCLHLVRAGCDQSKQESRYGELLHSTGLSEFLSFWIWSC